MTELFVYGTLVPGGEAWPHLERWVEGEPRADTVPGQLYDTGRGYPGATFQAAAAGWVHGVVVTLAPPDTHALAALDRYEGDEYERVLVRTASGLEVFTYAWIAPLDRMVPLADGRWMA